MAVLLLRLPASAQDVTEAALKAAFIYNFAQFTEWPADAVAPAKPLALCVIGDDAVAEALGRTVNARQIDGHSMTVSVVAALPARACHVLYLSHLTPAQAAQFTATPQDAPVLTIGDVEGFTDMGGISRFYFEHGRLRFTIRLQAVKRARLQISSRLLALAKLE